MKRNYPYTGQGAQQQAYGQPPPPAGPAPPLPSSGPPPPAAYANYGYGSVAPGRHAAAPMNGAGAGAPQQSQWNQQQWQQQPHYPPQSGPGAPAAGQYAPPPPPSQPQPMQSAPYRGPNAGHSSHNQAAAYGPHNPQQQTAQYPYQASTSTMHSPSPAPPSYGYSPSAPQHQNLAANNGNALNWPGAYASGSQAGPPSKKARYQAPAAPVPVPPYGAPGVAPMASMAPMGGNMAGGVAGPYGPAVATPSPQQPYAWQGPNAVPAAPHVSSQPGQQANFGRVSSGNAGRGGLSAQSARGGKDGRGGGAGNGPGRGMNRNGAQNRGNLSQGPSSQRAALPANPNASMNAARAQNGPAPAWGPHANAPSAAAVSRNGPAGPNAGASAQFGGGRRASTASSVHSDKNSRRAGGPAVPLAGSVTKPGFSSQNMIPIDAPRGPNGARNKAGKVGNDASSISKKGINAAAQSASQSNTASKNAVASRSGVADLTASAKDSGHGASSKRAHTDFRILGLEIKELDWSWFAPEALSKNVHGVDDVDIKQDPDQVNAESKEAAVDAASQAIDADDSKGKKAPQAERDQTADVDEAQSTRGDGPNNEENENQNTDTNVEAEQDPDETHNHDDEHAGHDEHALDAEGEAEDDDADGKADADADADAEGDADADADFGDDADDDAEAEAEADADADGDADADLDAELDLDPNGNDDVSMSQAETDTVASQAQHSVARTPEPNSELSNGKQAVQASKSSKADRAKMMANLRESTKLRFCFAAMSNAGPEGAPTGPKAEQIQEVAADASTELQVKTEDAAEVVEDKTAAQGEQPTAEAAAAAEVEKPANEDAAVGEDVKVEAASDAKEAETASTLASDVAAAIEKKTSEEQPAQPVEDATAEPTHKEGEAKHEEDNSKEEATAAEPPNEVEQSDQAATAASSKGKKAKSAAEPAPAPQAKGPPQLSLNRIFLSFAANRKRLAIDAEAVKAVRIHRSEHWVEIIIDASRQNASASRKKGEEYLVCNGTLLEKRAKGQENYTAVTRSEIASVWSSVTEPGSRDEAGHLELPPFFRLPTPTPSASASCSSSDLTFLVRLDPSAPLPEPTWLRKNDVSSLLANLQRGSSAISVVLPQM
ncbi:hypothetical protein NDA16_003911 [Ustilago loliicola]|nr:hypothetical protein NDA16_003911 [Ustilago loliicola]